MGGSTPPPSQDPGTFCLWQNRRGSVRPSVRMTPQHTVLTPGVYLGHQGTCRPQSPRWQLGKLVPSGTGAGPGAPGSREGLCRTRPAPLPASPRPAGVCSPHLLHGLHSAQRTFQAVSLGNEEKWAVCPFRRNALAPSLG